MSDAIIELKNVALKYRTKRKLFRNEYHKVFSDLSMSIYRGETLGIIGRNGVGKSTLLKLIAGIYMPETGEVIRQKNKISLLSLSLGFDQELSGYDNAILSSVILGATKSEAQGKMDSIIEFSELGKFIYQPVKSYSSGMKARLGFSVAIEMETDVLLIDEVLGVGDRVFREKAETALLERIASDLTVVFVSHSENQIKRVCNRVIWIEKGQVLCDGNAEDVINQYREYSSSKLRIVKD